MPEGLMTLLGKLTAYLVDWKINDYGDSRDRGVRKIDDGANVVSSQLSSCGLHVIAIDLDLPAYLVPSTTPGHSHLYIQAPMEWAEYRRILEALALGGVIEPGYVAASLVRGHTSLRLPWVKKVKQRVTGRPHPTSLMATRKASLTDEEIREAMERARVREMA